MALVEFRPLGVSVDVPHGSSLLDAARRARVRLEAPCNGGGTCGKCRVRLDPASRPQARIIGRHELSAADLESGWILLCSTLVEGDLAVDLPGSSERGLRILEDGRSAELPLAPWVTKRYDPARHRTELSAGERLLGSEDGDTAARTWGVAVDIGTTTLVVSLIDLCTGSATGSASALNPQAVHAQDVLSRVHLGSTEAGLETLHGELMGEIDRLIGVLAGEARVPRRRIYEVVVAGNTCMLHLAARVNPEPLGRYPYTPTLSGDDYRPAAALGLSVSRHGQVYFPPVVSGFVGADISAGILSTGLAATPGLTLFVDIGTNGEMVLARDGVLQATSTAAGPAFEGMNIACGMRAARGAIERCAIVDGELQLETIEDAQAVGLCGSGLLDAVAALVTAGVIEGSGRFTRNLALLPPGLSERLSRRDDKPVFALTDQVYLTQRDIRQVQLAKAAVRAGIDTLLKRNGVDAAAVDRALIAGSFGYHLTTRSLVDIGLFPAAFDGKVEYVGNTARTGAETLLTNGAARASLAEQVARVESVELANDPQFSDGFIAAMAFPPLRRDAGGLS
ncbi:ASKHA domain-containing protein [uncultured Thiodictyon sp.]|uniref:ASKHA domain-containing protein n=1 Tax=uncultured Thiodictyon sp. TaxID=1846217 RepID=UPI0025E542DD|nr:ASKHA domain-containing protein [uncultured Thiodictyon sp.]